MTTREYAGPHDTRRAAMRQAAATCRAEAVEAGVDYPIVATRYVGKKPKHWDTDRARYCTKLLSGPVKDGRTGKFWNQITERMKRIGAARITVDGIEVELAKAGVEMDADEMVETRVVSSE